MFKLIYLFHCLLICLSLVHGDFCRTENKEIVPETFVNFDVLKSVNDKYNSSSNSFSNSQKMIAPEYTENVKFGPYYFDESTYSGSTITNFNMKNYFENLTTYSPVNNIGSCGYVSLIQAMSYYDTFYNDNIIPETYDRFDSNIQDFSTLYSSSPGTLALRYDSQKYSSYYDFCHETQGESFESYLTVLNNILNETDALETFDYRIGAWNYSDVLNELYDTPLNAMVLQFEYNNQDMYSNLIKEIINSGNPAIVHILRRNIDGEAISRHSVVAYDYDDSGIYANFGWGANYNHKLLLGGDAGYDEVYLVASLDFSSMGHTHSNNYVMNNKSYCGCNVDDTVYMYKTNYEWYNIPQAFYWKLSGAGDDISFNIAFRSSPNGKDLYAITTTSNLITLPYIYWEYIIQRCSNYIYISLVRTTSSLVYNETITAIPKSFKKLSVFEISPDEYGFKDAYPKDYYTKENYQYHYKNNFSFRTRRYRTGYIRNEYITMSCIKTGITEAYIEYAFCVPIYKIEVELAHWRDYSHEWLDKNSGVAELQVYNFITCEWAQKTNLLSDEMELSRDRTNPTLYTINFNEPVYGFRFYSKINEARESERNRGRICIGDMKLYIDNQYV